MKFRQHIRVYGYPEALKERINQTKMCIFDINGVGKIDVWSEKIADKFNDFLIDNKIKFKRSKRPDSIRVKYLLNKNGLHKAVRGRKYKGDILYTVDANDERELLDKRDAVIEELKILRVPYEDVCKWVCETAPKVPAKKMFAPKKQEPIKEGIIHYKNPKKPTHTICGHDSTIKGRTYSNVTDLEKNVNCSACLNHIKSNNYSKQINKQENLTETLEDIAKEQKKLKNTVEDLKDKLSEAERKKMRIFAHEDMKARAGVLH